MTPVSAHRYLPRYQCKVMIQASAHRYLPKYRRQQCKDWKELKWEKVDFVHITRDLFCLKISFQLKPSFFCSFSLSLPLFLFLFYLVVYSKPFASKNFHWHFVASKRTQKDERRENNVWHNVKDRNEGTGMQVTAVKGFLW